MDSTASSFPKRKHPRLKEYDYSHAGSYFVTVCAKNMACVFSAIRPVAALAEQSLLQLTAPNPVGRDALIPPQEALVPPPMRFLVPGQDSFAQFELALTPIGGIADRYIQRISGVYPNVCVDHYVMMPNHIHLLVSIDDLDGGDGGMRASRPTLPVIVRSFKTLVSREVGRSIWQASFYERVVRNEREYRQIWRYIDDNPRRWVENEKQLSTRYR